MIEQGVIWRAAHPRASYGEEGGGAPLSAAPRVERRARRGVGGSVGRRGRTSAVQWPARWVLRRREERRRARRAALMARGRRRRRASCGRTPTTPKHSGWRKPGRASSKSDSPSSSRLKSCGKATAYVAGILHTTWKKLTRARSLELSPRREARSLSRLRLTRTVGMKRPQRAPQRSASHIERGPHESARPASCAKSASSPVTANPMIVPRAASCAAHGSHEERAPS
mmetsp:Transcript_64489/g.192631  ORF Transcript_64489/g.192631 Transcript_64489/m.192631 type:complete len:227 (-) Transcript_64489:277-957(-)